MLAAFAYDGLGRRTALTRGNGTATSYAYDALSRLGSLTQDLAGTAQDLTLGFSYNPTGQLVSSTRSNTAYSWTGHGSGSTASSADGLNRIAAQGGVAFSHDAKGNLTSDGSTSFVYDTRTGWSIIAAGTGPPPQGDIAAPASRGPRVTRGGFRAVLSAPGTSSWRPRLPGPPPRR